MFDNQNTQNNPASTGSVNPMSQAQPSDPTQPAYEMTPVSGLSGSTGNDDLAGIKNQALQSLTPLVDKLEQTPEEKFKTTMMLIQASDNASLIKRAYEAANQIADEKVRAQALIDVINEINYFTNQHGSDS